MCSAIRSLYRTGETVGEDLAIALCVFTLEWLKHQVITALRVWGPIPRTVKGDEDAVSIAFGKLLPVVAHHRVRRPMGGKCCHRSGFPRAYTHFFAAVATVLRRKD